MRNRKLSRRELLMTSTAAAGAMVMRPFDAFAQPSAVQGALIARAKSLELDTPYVPPPGDALEHHAAGFAKIMCSAVFVTGITATIVTFGFFPLAARRSWNPLSTGFQLLALIAA